MPPLRNPDVADLAPNGPTLTVYDEEHAVTRMLDAESDGDWQEVCRIVLRIDPEHYPSRARCAFESHLAREWAARVEYQQRIFRSANNRKIGTSTTSGRAREAIERGEEILKISQPDTFLGRKTHPS